MSFVRKTPYLSAVLALILALATGGSAEAARPKSPASVLPSAALRRKLAERHAAAQPRKAASPQQLAARRLRQRRLSLVNEALRQRGSRYVWGGASRGGFDCSGLIRYVFQKKQGITLPHSASAQAMRGKPVPNSELKPGDLLFFSTYRRGISHVGIYIGGGKFVHAANRRRGVRVDPLTGYYARRLRAARRLS